MHVPLQLMPYARRSPAEFEAEIQTNMNADTAPLEAQQVQLGAAQMRIRNRGAFLTHLALVRPGSGETVDVVYSNPNLSIPKLPATHAMMPVGKYNGLGEQHGFLRWAEYDVAYANPEASVPMTRLLARTALGLPIVSRQFELTHESTARITTVVTNPGATPLRTSLGEHLYLAMPPYGVAHDVRINNHTVNELLGDGAADHIEQGIARFYPDIGSGVDVRLPDGLPLRIGTDAFRSGPVHTAAGLGMLLWRRPARAADPYGPQPFMCFEPTIGFEENGANDLLTINPGGMVTLKTTITVG